MKFSTSVFRLGLALGLGVGLGHHVQVPAGELAGEADVLAAAADGLRQLVLGHRDIHAVRVLVDDDGQHFGRRHRVDDELRRVLVVRNDVDALAGDLVRDRLHARTAHADAGADRIDARLEALAPRSWRARPDRARRRGSGSGPGPTSGTSSLNSSMRNSRRGARQEQLRAARLRAHFLQERLDAVLRSSRSRAGSCRCAARSLRHCRRGPRRCRCGRRA